MDCSPPGSSVHGILQARILEWVAMPFSRESSRPRDGTQHCRWILYQLSYQGSPYSFVHFKKGTPNIPAKMQNTGFRNFPVVHWEGKSFMTVSLLYFRPVFLSKLKTPWQQFSKGANINTLLFLTFAKSYTEELLVNNRHCYQFTECSKFSWEMS